MYRTVSSLAFVLVLVFAVAACDREAGPVDPITGIRFLHLDHGGDGWDDGLTSRSGDASRNLLTWMRERSLFEREIADAGDSIGIAGLRQRLERDEVPLFVYMTGDGESDLSQADQEVLRTYLDRGGMLFADAGGPAWDRWFTGFVTDVVGTELTPIPADDPICRRPFVFLDGMPRFFDHGDKEILGMKAQDRWQVFYHPGDLNDVWKDGGSGVDRRLREEAFWIGCNVIAYALRHRDSPGDDR